MRPLLAAVVGLVISARAARAAAPELVLLPAAPLIADGERAHHLRLYLVSGGRLVTGGIEVKAALGEIVAPPTRESDGGFGFRYRPPRVQAATADQLTVRGPELRRQVQVLLEPSGSLRLSMEASPDPLVLGSASRAVVRLHVRDPAGRPARAALRLGASVGRISQPEEIEPGEYRASYEAPEERFPQVAIIAALSVVDRAFAAVLLRLAAKITVTGEGEAGGTMRVTVDGRSFGPAPIDAGGRFAVPVVVPPGGRAVGLSTDPIGNQRQRAIDLHLPDFPRLLFAAVPAELIANGEAQAEVVAFAIDERGQPARHGPTELKPDHGIVSAPSDGGLGVATWLYTAPSTIGTGAAVLRSGAFSLRIGLKPGPARLVTLVAPVEPLAAGSDQPGEIAVRVRDAAGAPVRGARLEATLSAGRVLGASERAAGTYALRVLPPSDPERAEATLHLEVAAVPSGPPRRLTLHPARAAPGKLAAEAWVDDDFGVPVAGAEVELASPVGASVTKTDRYGVAGLELKGSAGRFRITARLASLPGVEAALDYLAVEPGPVAVSSLRGGGAIESGPAPQLVSLDAQIPLRPWLPLDVRVTVRPERVAPGGTARVRVEVSDGRGHPMPGEIAFVASAGTLELARPLAAGLAELRFTAPTQAPPGGRCLVSVTELRTQVTAFAEVPVQGPPP